MVETITRSRVVLEQEDLLVCPNCDQAYAELVPTEIGPNGEAESALCRNCIQAVYGIDPDSLGEITVDDLEIERATGWEKVALLAFLAVALSGLVAVAALLFGRLVFGYGTLEARIVSALAWALTLGWMYVKEYFY